MDAQAHRHSDALVCHQSCLKRGQGAEHLQPRPYGPLGVILVRLWIAEVHQQAISQVLRDVTVKALDHGTAGGLIGTDDLAVVFRVEVPGEGGRAHQITKQDGELPAFGFRGAPWD